MLNVSIFFRNGTSEYRFVNSPTIVDSFDEHLLC